VVLGVVAVLIGTSVLRRTGGSSYLLIFVLAACFGLQNATVRSLGPRDLTTTVLTLTLTGLAADSFLGGGKDAKPHRRIGSVLAMFAGAAVGALLLQATTAWVVALAAVAVAAAATIFVLGPAEP
jgi:uncharacterized membrane protein YoaK (UPF0700 family)